MTTPEKPREACEPGMDTDLAIEKLMEILAKVETAAEQERVIDELCKLVK